MEYNLQCRKYNIKRLELTHLQCPLGIPSYCLWDFNNVMELNERVGGRIPIKREYYDFADTCSFLGLQDSPSMDCHFTYTVKYFEIDRLLINNS